MITVKEEVKTQIQNMKDETILNVLKKCSIHDVQNWKNILHLMFYHEAKKRNLL
jgi:hypothetical protein